MTCFQNNMVYNISFNYLSQIYVDMNGIIENVIGDDDMKYKRGIIKVIRLIYKQFCRSDSETEINISFEVQAALKALVEENDDEQLLEILDDYRKLLNVFHEAILEVYIVCQSVYGFDFKCYINKHTE